MLLFSVLYSVSHSFYSSYLLVSLLMQGVSAVQNVGQFLSPVYAQSPSEGTHRVNLCGVKEQSSHHLSCEFKQPDKQPVV